MALSMDPKPDVIFFMTDGIAGKNSLDIAEDISCKACGMKVVINTVALMFHVRRNRSRNWPNPPEVSSPLSMEGGVVEIVPLK